MMPNKPALNRLTRIVIGTVLILGGLWGKAHAERADRYQPTHIEADKITVDDAQKIQTLEGHVIVTRGTMRLEAHRVVIHQDAQGFQKGIATGGADDPQGLAQFRQKREGRADYVQGEGLRIEYDGRTDKAELFGRARVQSGADDVRGEYVVYDGLTDRYQAGAAPVSSAPGQASGQTSRARARATIQPRHKDPVKGLASSGERVAPDLKPDHRL
jgi:lipopolysaccharide export system protein LptA